MMRWCLLSTLHGADSHMFLPVTTGWKVMITGQPSDRLNINGYSGQQSGEFWSKLAITFPRPAHSLPPAPVRFSVLRETPSNPVMRSWAIELLRRIPFCSADVPWRHNDDGTPAPIELVVRQTVRRSLLFSYPRRAVSDASGLVQTSDKWPPWLHQWMNEIHSPPTHYYQSSVREKILEHLTLDHKGCFLDYDTGGARLMPVLDGSHRWVQEARSLTDKGRHENVPPSGYLESLCRDSQGHRSWWPDTSSEIRLTHPAKAARRIDRSFEGSASLGIGLKVLGTGDPLPEPGYRVLVGSVQPGSAAAQQGVKAGWAVLSVNGTSSKGMDRKDVLRMLGAAGKGKRVITFSDPAAALPPQETRSAVVAPSGFARPKACSIRLGGKGLGARACLLYCQALAACGVAEGASVDLSWNGLADGSDGETRSALWMALSTAASIDVTGNALCAQGLAEMMQSFTASRWHLIQVLGQTQGSS